jgi:2-amino-4-hydroxy-6-hydroxymethyldihydropteridine diphosphokinase
MNEFHLAYLSLGSNIEPEVNLPRAVQTLSQYGEILKISNVWESEPVGTTGDNYLNVCLLFKSKYDKEMLKEDVIQTVEYLLGRRRTEDKFAPRTMDIDLVIFDDEPIGTDWPTLAYIVLPLSEIFPDYINPATNERITETATRLRQNVWMETRRGVLS